VNLEAVIGIGLLAGALLWLLAHGGLSLHLLKRRHQELKAKRANAAQKR
jgi:hypothetical protein